MTKEIPKGGDNNKDAVELKEFEEIKFWIEHHITTSMTKPQLDGCEALVQFFKKRKFKKDIPTHKEIEVMVKQLEDSIQKKKDSLRQRDNREKKKNES